jgi:hypothetical protein
MAARRAQPPFGRADGSPKKRGDLVVRAAHDVVHDEHEIFLAKEL